LEKLTVRILTHAARTSCGSSDGDRCAARTASQLLEHPATAETRSTEGPSDASCRFLELGLATAPTEIRNRFRILKFAASVGAEEPPQGQGNADVSRRRLDRRKAWLAKRLGITARRNHQTVNERHSRDCLLYGARSPISRHRSMPRIMPAMSSSFFPRTEL